MLDIFKKENKNKPVKLQKPIIIDTHERSSLVPSELSALQIPFEFSHLPVGDYLISNVLVERKSLSDLQSSIINKRIFEQISQLKAQKNMQALLIVELDNSKDIYREAMHPNALRGFFLSLTREDGIPFIFSQDEKDTAKYLCLLNQKVQKQHISIRPSRVLRSKKDVQQFILEGFPGVGPATAKKLLDRFKNLRNIINAPEAEMMEILGKKYEKFKEILD